MEIFFTKLRKVKIQMAALLEYMSRFPKYLPKRARLIEIRQLSSRPLQPKCLCHWEKWERRFPYHARRQSFMNESRRQDYSEDASRKDQLLNFQIVIATVADDSNSNTIAATGGISSSASPRTRSLVRQAAARPDERFRLGLCCAGLGCRTEGSSSSTSSPLFNLLSAGEKSLAWPAAPPPPQ